MHKSYPRQAMRLGVLLGALLLPGLASAWGPQGHQAVGAIADQLIAGSMAQEQVKLILSEMGPQPELLNLKTVAVWADCAKSVDANTGIYKNDDSKYPECVPLQGDKAVFEEYVHANPKHAGYHFTDISTFQPGYGHAVGWSEADVVHAIGAAILRLQHPDAALPAPFVFTEREALMVLVHLVGDLHQPLHVEALYLDGQGQPVNPDATGDHPGIDTLGGNWLEEAGKHQSLHRDWDAVPEALAAGGRDQAGMLELARQVPVAEGTPLAWPAEWASDTLQSARAPFDVFGTLRFKLNDDGHDGDLDHTHTWTVRGVDAAYVAQANALKKKQLVKAGARLAQLLQAIWPGPATPPPVSLPAYLEKPDAKEVKSWVPERPAAGSAVEQADLARFEETRALVRDKAPRALEAAQDDVYAPEPLLGRFTEALGLKAPLTAQSAPKLLELMGRVESDAGNLLKPVKPKVSEGGRHRPFYDHFTEPSCLFPVDLAGHRADDVRYDLISSGSYPSGHAQIGLLSGLILSEVVPERSAELVRRGIEFGDSRVICGFHYPSDLAAGRLMAGVLFSRLMQNADFQKDLRLAREQVAAEAARQNAGLVSR